MDPIYVTGHRNPDTDSIVAAIAYAALRNACGEREYEPACLGQISEETQSVLEAIAGEDLNGDGVVAPDVTCTDAEATAVELDHVDESATVEQEERE